MSELFKGRGSVPAADSDYPTGKNVRERAVSALGREFQGEIGEAVPIQVEVSFAEPDRAVVKTYFLEPPATVEDVLRVATSDPAFAGIDIAHAAVGIFGRPAAGSQRVSDGDRVEIYRPLAVDPKTARRTRAREAQKKSQGRR